MGFCHSRKEFAYGGLVMATGQPQRHAGRRRSPAAMTKTAHSGTSLITQPLTPKGEPKLVHSSELQNVNFLVFCLRGFPFRGQGLHNEG